MVGKVNTEVDEVGEEPREPTQHEEMLRIIQDVQRSSEELGHAHQRF